MINIVPGYQTGPSSPYITPSFRKKKTLRWICWGLEDDPVTPETRGRSSSATDLRKRGGGSGDAAPSVWCLVKGNDHSWCGAAEPLFSRNWTLDLNMASRNRASVSEIQIMRHFMVPLQQKHSQERYVWLATRAITSNSDVTRGSSHFVMKLLDKHRCFP